MDSANPTPPALAYLTVLASGSGGNCSVLMRPSRDPSCTRPELWLLDAGLSPRRTRAALEQIGLDFADVRGLLITHLDHDHYHGGWCEALPSRTRVLMHVAHRDFRRSGFRIPAHTEGFEDAFELAPGLHVRPWLGQHDDEGVCAFRIDMHDTGDARHASLGFATDLGRIEPALIELFEGVGVLAIESNYCPDMQMASNRPDFLKRRIMGGSGHLSNHQAAAAVLRIQPTQHVIFLHLSRECNEPAIVCAMHEGSDYEFTIADQFVPTRRVAIRAEVGSGRLSHMPRTRALATPVLPFATSA